MPPGRQAVQKLELPLHSAHRESQARHSLVALAYLPLGHAERHVPASKYGVPVSGQLTQSVLPAPLHARHEASQATHVATEPTVAANVPLPGHWATHEPLCRKGALADEQLTQSVLDAPVQVPHVASHGWQTLLLSAYLPIGRQESRHEPGASKKGFDEAHAVHSAADGPEHAVHVSWHGAQTSLEVLLPPEQPSRAQLEYRLIMKPCA